MNRLWQPGIRAINHLISVEPWASERLRQHAGARVSIDLQFTQLQLLVGGDGLFQLPETGQQPDVIIRLPADAPLNLLLARDSFFASVKIEGAVDLAESLAFVFRNLRWDVEADLAEVVGDIVAHRIVRIGRSFAAALMDAGERTSRNVAEYVTEEARWVVTPPEMAGFGTDVDRLRDDLARLEKRIARLAG